MEAQTLEATDTNVSKSRASIGNTDSQQTSGLTMSRCFG